MSAKLFQPVFVVLKNGLLLEKLMKDKRKNLLFLSDKGLEILDEVVCPNWNL